MNNIFSNVVSNANVATIINDTEYDEISVNSDAFFNINNVSYSVEKEGSSVKITILPNFIHETFTYYLGENPLNGIFKTSNIFTLDSLDTVTYKMAIKNEKGILVIFDEINVSTI